MEHAKKRISALGYYLLVSNLLNLAWIMLGIGALFVFMHPLQSIHNLPVFLTLILLALLPKGVIAASVTYGFHKRSVFDREQGTRLIGRYFGHFYCMILGGFLGAWAAKWLGAVIGAIGFFFLGRWIGPKIGSLFGAQIDRIFVVLDTTVIESNAA